MTRFQFCKEWAKRIVDAYREEAQGCDPQNSGIAAAMLATAAIGAGTSIYTSSKQSKAAEENANALRGLNTNFDPQLLGQPAQLDLNSILGNVLSTNRNNLGSAQSYTNRLNAGDFQQFMKYIKKIQPSFKPIQKQVGENALSFARGELPSDTVSSIGRAAAERGIQGGYGYGSQGGKTGALANLNLRNLGLTSLDLTKYGTNLGLQVNQSAKQLLPNLSSAKESLFSPAQGLQLAGINTDWLNKFRMQDVEYQNAAELSNITGQNTIGQNIADRQYSSALNQAGNIQATGTEIGKLLSQYGTYMNQNQGGFSGNYNPSGTGTAYYNGQAIPRATLA